MTSLSLRRGAVGIAAASLAAAALASVPTQAHAAVEDTYLGGYASTWEGEGTCTVAFASPPDGSTWSDNGAPFTASHSDTGTSTAGGDPADVVDLAAAYSATIKATPIDGGPATITASGWARASAVPRLASSVCRSEIYALAEADGEFTLAKPMWAVITLDGGRATKGGQGRVELHLQDGEIDLDIPGRTTSTTTALLPAGEVELEFEASTNWAYSPDPASRNVYAEPKAKIELLPLGHPSVAAGKAKAFVQLRARACGNGAVAAALTKKVAKKAKRVTVTVNGKKAATFQGKKLKKRSFSLAAASSSKANVVATVTLKNGKKVTVTRSYLACS